MIERDENGVKTGRMFDECLGECGHKQIQGHFSHPYLCRKCKKILKESRK